MKQMFAAAILAGALVPAVADAQAQAPALLAGTRLDIVARGEVVRVPDIAIISAGVVTQAKDAKTALAENGARMTRVLAALKRAGVDARDVATSSINLSPQYRYADNQPPVVTGYQASNTVTIRFRDIGASGAILDTLVAEGSNQINGPSLVIDKPEAALDEARVAAMRTARTRAELYAKTTALTIKRIVSIAESVDMPDPRPYQRMMAQASDSMAKTEIAPGEQSVGVTLSVTFELN